MSPIVADTTLLRYLIIIDAVHILPVLFERVIVPPEVVAELQRARTPAQVRSWMHTPPRWLRIQPPTLPRDPALRHLGAGEHEALLLMQEGVAPLLVTDDRSAYRAALARGIPVLRTLRILEMAAEQALIDLPTALARLQAAEFYMPDNLVEDMLARDAARKAAAQEPPPETQET